MKRLGATATSADFRCAGTTRSAALCRGHARYACACGRHWCGTHIIRDRSQLRCPLCAQAVHLA